MTSFAIGAYMVFVHRVCPMCIVIKSSNTLKKIVNLILPLFNDTRFNPFDMFFFYIQFICSVTVPGYQGNLQAAIAHTSTLAAWERFGVEMVLTFIVVLAYFMSTDTYKSYFGVSSLSIGAAYGACSFVSVSNKKGNLPFFVFN